MTAHTEAAQRSIDLRPLFAPRSMALVGASPKNDTARMLRENIARVGAATRPYNVNPNYDEIDGGPCYPDIAALPEAHGLPTRLTVISG